MEYAISTSSKDAWIHVWDIRTGVVTFSFKGNQCLPNTLATTGQLVDTEYIFSSQEKALVNVYSFQKQGILSKIIVPEQLSCIQISYSSLYCCAGGVSGRCYLWELSTGRLIRTWDKHYKQVSKICFNQTDDKIITSGADSMIYSFSVIDILQNRLDFKSYPGHSLPITGLVVYNRIYSSSLDRVVKIWDLEGPCLATINLPNAITCLTVNSLETIAFCGCSNGNIYSVDLSTTNDSQPIFKGHSNPVTCLDLSLDETLLVSSSEDCKCIVWDPFTRQILHTFTQHKGPVTNIKVIMAPKTQVTLVPKMWDRIPQDSKECMVFLDPLEPIESEDKETDEIIDTRQLQSKIAQLEKENSSLYAAVVDIIGKKS